MKNHLLERFLDYVKILTPSDKNGTQTPSSKAQFALAHRLEEEMTRLGISGVYTDEHCYVYGHLPASAGLEDLPALGFLAHMDTVSDFCSSPVIPVIHEDYDGNDLYLPAADRTIRVKDFPHLKNWKGRTVITSDGTTILGADDKAGIAEIMTMAEILLTENIPHGKICLAFTPDEEIGSGAELLDLETFGADFAFTLDGNLEGEISYETFNAASAQVQIRGVNVHPGSAKDIMVNAAAVACEFQSMLPDSEQPRTTSGYEGFYHLTDISGTVEKAEMDYIVRDHDHGRFESRKKNLKEIADRLNGKYGADTVSVTLSDTYYNMSEILADHMHLIENAKKAVSETGLTPLIRPVRGGTDGARLSFRGLPCPNLGTGGFGFHGPYEHISLEGMESAVKMLLAIVRHYSA